MKEDNIDKRIERVAESVGSKRAAMRRWEAERISSDLQRQTNFRRWRAYGLSAAASVVLICCIGVSLYVTRNGDGSYGTDVSAPIYRGGSRDIVEIQAMIDSAQYEMALQAIDVTLADTVINPSFTSERQDYLRSLNANREYELLWLKINVLIKSGKTNEAISLLKQYVDVEGEHQNDAQELLNKLDQ